MSEIKELVSKLNSTFVNDTASRSNKNSFAEKGVLRSEC